MHVRLLGEVSAGPTMAQLRPVHGAITQTVLGVLASDAGKIVTLDQLSRAAWDNPPASWRNAIHVAVSRLRDHLGHDHLRTSHGGYTLTATHPRVDTVEVTTMLDTARAHAAAHQWEDTLLGCTTLTTIASQPALPGVHTPWASTTRARVDHQTNEAHLMRAHAWIALNRHTEAIDELTWLTYSRPLDESITTTLMDALAATGRASEAITAYDALRHRLRDELGVDPSPTSQSAFLSLLRRSSPDQ